MDKKLSLQIAKTADKIYSILEEYYLDKQMSEVFLKEHLKQFITQLLKTSDSEKIITEVIKTDKVIEKIISIGKEYFVDEAFTSSDFDSMISAQLINIFN